MTATATLCGATRNTSAYGVDLYWRDTNTLEAQYLQARWSKLPRPKLDVNGRAVTLILREGIGNPNAPAGSMAPRG